MSSSLSGPRPLSRYEKLTCIAAVVAGHDLLRTGFRARVEHVVVERRVREGGNGEGEGEAGEEVFHGPSSHWIVPVSSAWFSSACPVSCQWIIDTGIMPAPFTSSK